MFLLQTSHLAIHLPFLPNGFLFYECPFNDLRHQFYDLYETYITMRQHVNTHMSQFNNCCSFLNSCKVFRKNGYRAGSLCSMRKLTKEARSRRGQCPPPPQTPQVPGDTAVTVFTEGPSRAWGRVVHNSKVTSVPLSTPLPPHGQSHPLANPSYDPATQECNKASVTIAFLHLNIKDRLTLFLPL